MRISALRQKESRLQEQDTKQKPFRGIHFTLPAEGKDLDAVK